MRLSEATRFVEDSLNIQTLFNCVDMTPLSIYHFLLAPCFFCIPSQVQLQNLMTSKYIAHFLEEVSGWQKKLSIADSVISIWFEVQRTWSHLESIFIGSEDIRNQLPEDSKRFDGIDTDFKVLLQF